MKILKHILIITLNIVVFSTLLFVAFTLISSRVGIIADIRSFNVATGSMEPTLPVGSLIYTMKKPSYESGDIISFQRQDKIITHRIVKKQTQNNNTFYIVKGDANNAPDGEKVPANQVIGNVLVHIPYVGKFIFLIKTIPGFIAFIGVPTVIFIGFELAAIKRELEKEFVKKHLAQTNANEA